LEKMSGGQRPWGPRTQNRTRQAMQENECYSFKDGWHSYMGLSAKQALF